jgi:hypothetical protein
MYKIYNMRYNRFFCSLIVSLTMNSAVRSPNVEILEFGFKTFKILVPN